MSCVLGGCIPRQGFARKGENLGPTWKPSPGVHFFALVQVQSLRPYITKLFRMGVTVGRPRAMVTKYWLVVSMYICLLTVLCNDISRNTAQGTGSTTARIGGVLAPYIALMVSVNCCYPVHFRRLR